MILEHLSSESLRITEEKQKSMHADHAAKGLLRSGATIKNAVRIIEEEASAFVEKAIDDVAAVAQDTDAFALISSSATAVFRGYEPHLQKAVNFSGSGESNRSARTAGEKLFAEARARIFKQLEIHRFTFIKTSKGELAARLSNAQISITETTQTEPVKNRGGKPLAKHWDTMWAAIAVKLHNGDLDPKTQADIERAMLEWLASQGIYAGETTIRKKARSLWQAMIDAD